jgi:hypothetical protein
MERARRFEEQGTAAAPVLVSPQKAQALRVLLAAAAKCDPETICLWALTIQAGERPPAVASEPRAKLAAALADVPDDKLAALAVLIGAALPLHAADITMLSAEVLFGKAPSTDFTTAAKKAADAQRREG